MVNSARRYGGVCVKCSGGTFAGFVKTALIQLNYYTTIMINGACHDEPSYFRSA